MDTSSVPLRLLGLLAISSLLWVAAALFSARAPSVTFPPGSDHYSHTMSTILFFERGLAIYQQPISELCAGSALPTARAAAVAANWQVPQADLCWSQGRVLAINWQQFPRPYPPGQLLYFLPEAWLFSRLELSFASVNALSVAKLLLVAHLAWFGAWRLVQRMLGTSWLSFALLSLMYLELLRWSLAGQYDAVSLLCLFFALDALNRGRPTRAWLMYGLALALHFRALWFLPLGLWSLWLAGAELRQRFVARAAWRRVTVADGLSIFELCTGVALVTAALLVFTLLIPHLYAFPQTNPLRLSNLNATLLLPAASALLYAALAVRGKAYLALACLLWSLTMVVATPQLQHWHSLFLLPLALLGFKFERPSGTNPAYLATSCHGVERTPARDLAAAGLLLNLTIGTLVCDNRSLPPTWLLGFTERLLGMTN